VTFAVGAFAVILQLVLVWKGHEHLGETEDVGRPELLTRLVRFASYLTIWSNVAATVTVGTLALDPGRDGRWWRAFRLFGVVVVSAGGVVHFFLLRPLLDLDGADLLADKLLHVVVPLLVAVGWLAFGPRNRIDRGDIARFAVIPVVWLVYTLVRGAFVDWYPYPFVDVLEHGYARVITAAVGIGAAMLLLAVLARWADRRLPATDYDAAPESDLLRRRRA
jgi:hypothetical protein